MSKSKVYFIDFSASPGKNMAYKIRKMLNISAAQRVLGDKEYCAVKIHFGEDGNFNYIRPQYAKLVIDFIKEHGSLPFLTDTNTLYTGRRANALEHITLALEHGFGYNSTGAPLIIADGLAGEASVDVPVKSKHTKTAKIGAHIAAADSLFVLSHFKGHEQAGFGGAVKNLGMGGASRLGKLFMHSSSQPYISEKMCTFCKVCGNSCPTGAIYYENKKAHIDYAKCIGCGECIVACHFGAIKNKWDESLEIFSEKMAEYALAIVKNKKRKAFYMNFIMNVSPDCDCWSFADAAIVPDIGIAASFDPIALDRASADFVNRAQSVGPSGLSRENAEDKFCEIHPQVNWKHQLEYGEKIGLGSNEYEVIEIK